ncbi:hemolysin type calcium-binding protein [Stella humosa]|uniref:Hemolysin type calcium-binding protein n=1 Tax=Stella humosa TaxID=94 RepID=A0A3N1LXE7_9PROT|nr:hypothetical protein [Stella humosa]ROP99863.1 hemolysin type calcium-binding protein [Stella humosa]BBK30908.1 hypothetical protein STHU_15420 [Stella humosa]
MATGDPIVDTLIRDTSGLWNTLAGDIVGTPVTLTYSFLDRLPAYSRNVTFVPFNATMKEAARAIFAQFEAVSQVRFIEVADAGDGGLIRLGMSYEPVNLAFAGYPSMLPTAGDLYLNAGVAELHNPTPGSLAYRTIMHELGHTLGMFHPGNYNVQGDPPPPPYLPPELDNGGNTVMSYGSRLDGTWASEPAVFDIRALQYAYGMLEPGRIGNLTYGSAEAETLLGTPETDYMHGQGGADAIGLDGGDDGARGNAGDDTLIGAAGADSLFGNEGSDLILGGDDGDFIDGGEDSDDVNGNRGQDTVYGGDGADLVRGGRDDDVVDGAGGDDRHVNGNLGNDLVYGGGGDDTIFGGGGNDTLVGEWGRDRLSGDLGDDMLIADGDGDVFVFASGQGRDMIVGFQHGGGRIEIAGGINGTDIVSFAAILARATEADHQGQPGAVIDLGGGHSLTIAGMSKAQLQADDFLFV